MFVKGRTAMAGLLDRGGGFGSFAVTASLGP